EWRVLRVSVTQWRSYVSGIYEVEYLAIPKRGHKRDAGRRGPVPRRLSESGSTGRLYRTPFTANKIGHYSMFALRPGEVVRHGPSRCMRQTSEMQHEHHRYASQHENQDPMPACAGRAHGNPLLQLQQFTQFSRKMHGTSRGASVDDPGSANCRRISTAAESGRGL